VNIFAHAHWYAHCHIDPKPCHCCGASTYCSTLYSVVHMYIRTHTYSNTDIVQNIITCCLSLTDGFNRPTARFRRLWCYHSSFLWSWQGVTMFGSKLCDAKRWIQIWFELFCELLWGHAATQMENEADLNSEASFEIILDKHCHGGSSKKMVNAHRHRCTLGCSVVVS